MRAIITRFAPAPTGFLHLGHVVNMIYVWGVARQLGGRVLLRIEDHDRQRSRASYERAILDDLGWLGFAADEPLVRQSGRDQIYRQALERLRAQRLVYACDCARAQPYPGTCRARAVADADGISLRVRFDPMSIRFDDRRHGPQLQQPAAQCGDMVIRDREGNWTYQFAVTVDDMEQGITLIVRGDDLLESTGRQLQLARLLGRETMPMFLHHSLIMKRGVSATAAAQKLSKSDRDTGVRDLRAAGWSAARVIGHAAFSAGLIPESHDVGADEVSSIIPTSEVDV